MRGIVNTKRVVSVWIVILTLLMGGSHLAASNSSAEPVGLTGRIVTINDPEYHTARLNWNLYFSRYPLAIVFVQNKYDVVNAINFCREKKIPFRIRSGRHSFEGWSSLDGGIIIDVSEMKQIQVDVKKRLARVQAGVRQGDVVMALGQYGLTIPTGLEIPPGISGVTLGGGIGLLIREFGLTCDRLKEVEVVTANGEIIRASKHKHRDLFFACQGGGGGNFGVVTEFVYSAIPMGNVVMYQIEYPYEVLETLVDTWQRWFPFQTERLNSSLSLNPQSNSGPSHVIFGIFDGSQEELLELLAPLLAIPGSDLDIFQTVSYLESFLFFANFPNPPTKDKISSTFVDKLLPSEAIHAIKLALDTAVNERANIYFLACGGFMRKIPRKATPFWNRKSLFFFEWEQPWVDDQQADRSIIWVENLRLALQPFLQGSYVNVPDFNIVDWKKQYYGRNFKKLEKIKAKYDPDNLFTYELQAIPPE